MNKTISILGILPFINPICTLAKDIKKPNIIVIYTDDQRYDALGCDGNKVIQTSALNNFLSNGIRFDNANVAFALSSPSRAAMLTGCYGSCNGVLYLDSKLTHPDQTVARYMKEEGYTTGMSGKWHVKPMPKDVGFDFYDYFFSNGAYYNRTINDMGKVLHPDEHCDSYCAKRSVDFIREQANSNKPFFLYHCTQLPHMNGKLVWEAKQETKDRYNVDDMPYAANRLDDLKGKPEYLKTVRNRTKAKDYGYPDIKAIQSHTRDYYSVITEMDEFLKLIIDELKRDNLLENTYILFMGDNGWMLGDHGFTSKVLPYAASTHVPFFALGPGIKKNINASLVSNIDIAPTVLELAGAKVPSQMQGKSLLPILKGKKKEVRKCFVYEGLGSYGKSAPVLGVLSKDYRFIVTYDTKECNNVIFEELYSVTKDPDEMHNLAKDPAYAKVKVDLYKYIIAHKKEVLNEK